jgi:hypothetical protein
MARENAKENMPSMRIELISEDIYSFAEIISEYETSVLTVKLRGRIQAVSSLIRRVRNAHDLHVRCVEIHLACTSQRSTFNKQTNSILQLSLAIICLSVVRMVVRALDSARLNVSRS